MVRGRRKKYYIFFNIEKRNVECTSMVTLNINGKLTENVKEIYFYDNLYSDDNKLSNAQSFLDSIKEDIQKRDESSIKMCDQGISLDEVLHCINKLARTEKNDSDPL